MGLILTLEDFKSRFSFIVKSDKAFSSLKYEFVPNTGVNRERMVDELHIGSIYLNGEYLGNLCYTNMNKNEIEFYCIKLGLILQSQFEIKNYEKH